MRKYFSKLISDIQMALSQSFKLVQEITWEACKETGKNHFG